MKLRLPFLTIITLLLTSIMSAEEEKGIIGRSYHEGMPIIWKLVDELPTEEKMKQLPWLTVISWKYDGSGNNGMPADDENDRMIILEDTIEKHVEENNFCEHANSRTGNGLKELVYYIHDKDLFIEKFNEALKGHSRYPIEINFYNDPDWKEFHDLHRDFTKNKKT